MDESKKENRIAWHQGFYGGIELELRQWKSVLTFRREVELNKEPIIADMLIIKKPPDVRIDNPIARCFKEHNLLEYKSPEDTLSVDGFFKGLSYVYLYKSQGKQENEIPITEMTYSAFCFHRPKKLFGVLQGAGFQVDKTENGIYAVIGHSGLVIQVIVIRELAQGTHPPLRAVLPDADEEDVRRFLAMGEMLTKQADLENFRAALGISVSANEDLYKRLKEELYMDTETVLRNVFPEYFMKERTAARAEGKAEGRAEGRAEGKAEGKAEGRAEGKAEGRAEGKAEGSREKEYAVVAKMLRRQEPMEKIMEYTDATVDTISRIADSIGIKLAG